MNEYYHGNSFILLFPSTMNFNIKMDDKKIKVDVESTNLKDILQYCKPKEQLVLVKKFGLLTWKEIPLQRIGADYNMTRERVRQIETQALMRFRRLIVGNDKYVKVLEEAKKILDTHWGLLSEEDLVKKIVNKNMFKFSAQELKLILVSDFDINYLKRNKLLYKSFYKDPLFEDLLTKMTIWITNYFEKKKESEDVYEFIEKVKNEFVTKHTNIEYLNNALFYMNFFSVIRAVKVFDGKVGLATFADVWPKTIKLKIVYVMKKINKPIHFQELPAKIMEWFPDKPVKVTTVHNELVKHNQTFVNIGLGLYALREWGFEGGLVKDIIVRIFEKFKRPMSVKEISKELLKEKMVSPNTVLLNLQKYKDLFRRVDKWVYELADTKSQKTTAKAKKK